MSSQPLPYVQIVVTINGKPLNTYTFSEAEILIGRGADCHVPLDNPGASRHHAKITRVGDTLTLHDLQSGNGTVVNGKPVTQAVIKPNDTIGISKFSLVAKLTEKPLKETPPSTAAAAGPDFGEERTVFLSAQDRAKLVQQVQPGARPATTPLPNTVVTPLQEKKSPVALVFAAGLAAGIFIGWLLWA